MNKRWIAEILGHIIKSEWSTDFAEYKAKGGWTHSEETCQETKAAGGPQNCAVHNPSQHALSGSRQILRASGLIENQCPHGIGHPDPDSLAYYIWCGDDYLGVHGCDGCCNPKKEPSNDR